MPAPQRKLSVDRLGQLIYEIRDQRVMLDSDLAQIYGVTTKRLNEQLRRNRDRFPKDFAFRLTSEEASFVRSRIAASSGESIGMRSQIATTSKKRRRKTHRPWAFTEHGALQAANVLRSKRAVAMSLFVIRAFIELRDNVAANAAILKRLAEIDKTLLLHDSALRDVYKKLLPLLAPPTPTKKRIGFHP